MQEHPNPIPETAIKPKATPTKKSTARTKAFRDKKASVGLQRLDIYTSDEIKSEVREIAKKENITAGIAAESLIALGIEAYFKGRIQSNTGFSDVPYSPTAQSDTGNNPVIANVSPRHRLELLLKPDPYQPNTTISIADVLSTTTYDLSDIDKVETSAKIGEDKLIVDQRHSKNISGGMDRERHKIKPFDPTEPSGRLHSELLKFKGQIGYFYVETYPFSERKYELILFQPKDGGTRILITDVSNDVELLNFLKKMQSKTQTTQVLDTQSQVTKIVPNDDESAQND